jgi:hypothetical protein
MVGPKRMSQTLLQDFIRLAVELDRNGFLQNVTAPILIAESARAGFALRGSQTRLLKNSRTTALSRSMILHGNQLPVLEVRRRLPGTPGQVRLGRLPENDLVLSDDSVSSRHACFTRDARTATFTVQDVGSSNGTLVNTALLSKGQSVVLFDGDLLSFGDSNFLFFYPEGLYEVLKANLAALNGKDQPVH